MINHFFAYVSRMKLIQRWSLMRSIQPENVQEHSLQVAIIAHALAVIKNTKFGGSVNPERVALLALYHDVTEVLTGDLPTPVKYFNPEIRKTYKEIEKNAADQLLNTLPSELRAEFSPLLHERPQDSELWNLVKSADKICAYVKCLEEKNSGNPEFSVAEKTILKTIESMATPETQYFMEIFVPSFNKNIDEMSANLKSK